MPKTNIHIHFFAASIEDESLQLTRSKSIDIARLLKRLEGAISRGDHADAAKLAKELATLKVTCSVTHKDEKKAEMFTEVKKTPVSSSETEQHETDRNKMVCSQPATNKEFNSSDDQKINKNVNNVEYPLNEVSDNHGVQKRDLKPSVNRREVKSDNVSKLIESSSSPTLPSLIENFT